MASTQDTILALAKNLLETPTEEKWRAFQNHLVRFGPSIHPEFPAFLELVEQYKRESGSIPQITALMIETSSPGDEKLAKFVQEIAARPSVQADTSVFISSVRNQETELIKERLGTAIREGTLVLSPARLNNPAAIETAVGTHIQMLQGIRDLARREKADNTIFAAGDAGVEIHRRRVEEEERKAREGELNFYDIGIDHFKDTVKIAPGDFYLVGGFTSHGKSIELRRLAYHLQTTACLNIYYLTFEMTADVIEDLVLLRHAHNKVRFPNTPLIPRNAHKMKTWTRDQRDFFMEVVVPDYYNNNQYGVCKFNYPGKLRYTLDDLRTDMLETERNEMPIDALVVDYPQKMWPIIGESRRDPTTSDYNQLFADLKQFGLNYRNYRGEKKPLPVIGAAQISRKGLEECLKNEGQYDESAFSHFSEIERSADTLMTVLMTREMRDQGQVRHQQIKGRNTGVTTEPVDLRIDINHGELLTSLTAFSNEAMQDAISRLF